MVVSASRTAKGNNLQYPIESCLKILSFLFLQCLVYRNEYILAKGGYVPPKATKTGTTIAGIIFKDGVILGADTRATDGNIVAEKNCQKIHYISSNI